MNTIEVINNLPHLISFNPASDSDIAGIENLLGLKLAEDYKAYIKHFGAIMADGIELTGFSKAKGRDVISVTKRELELNNNINKPVYVIEDTGMEGIVIWQEADGKVYESSPYNGFRKIADSLSEYLINRQKTG